MNNFNSYGTQNYHQTYQTPQYFPQPQGNVYMVNSSLEVSNIPIGSNLTMILCPSEETMYLKSLQNGSPCMMAYKITPYENKVPYTQPDEPNYEERFKRLEEQIESLKKQMSGGKISELF